MGKMTRIQPADLVDCSRLVIAATLGITAVVDAMHVLRSSGIDPTQAPGAPAALPRL